MGVLGGMLEAGEEAVVVGAREEAVMLGEESEMGWMVRGVGGSCIELSCMNLVLDDSI